MSSLKTLVATLLCLAMLTACPKPLASDEAGAARTTTLRLFLASVHVATIEERAHGSVVERTSRLVGSSSDVARLRVTLDERGFVIDASYDRQGPRGDRKASLRRRGDRTTLVTDHGEHVLAEGRPPVLLEVLHHVRPAAPTDVTFLDVASGETLPGRVETDGQLTLAIDEHGAVLARASHDPAGREGPGLFLETQGAPPARQATLHPAAPTFPGPSGRVLLVGLEGLPRAAFALDAAGQRTAAPDDGTGTEPEGMSVTLDATYQDPSPPTPTHTSATPFLEVDDDAVQRFAAAHGKQKHPAAAALSLAVAIHDLLDTSGGGGPPSAVRTLETQAGDCDDATALLVAALRANGHPSRPVVGYRHHDGRLIPHAWAEVYDGETWLPVDALVPGLGPFSSHLKLFEGLGSPLTMGRVLGALRIEARPASQEADSETADEKAR